MYTIDDSLYKLKKNCLKIIQNDIQQSARIVQNYLDKGNITVFCGAGVSISSGIPCAIPIVKGILNELGCSVYDINRFIKKHELPIPFESIIQVLKETLILDSSKKFIGEFITLFKAEPNNNHFLIGKLLEKKAIESIVTTNFDCCIEKCLKKYFKQKKLIVYGEEEYSLRKLSYKEKIIKLHGCIKSPSLLGATVDQITKDEYFGKVKIVLNKILPETSAILFLGYSCSDKWDITKVFNEYSKQNSKLPEVLFWQHSSDLSEIPSENQKKIFKGFSCTWMSGDTNLLVEKLALLNNIKLINKGNFIPPRNILDKPVTNKNFVLGKLFQASGYFKFSEKYLNVYIKKDSINKSDKLNVLHSLESLGDICRKLKKSRTSKLHYQSAINLNNTVSFNTIRNKNLHKASLFTKISMLLLDGNKFVKANEYMKEAIEIIKHNKKGRLSIEQKFQIAETYNDFAFMLYQNKNYLEAENYWVISLSYKKDISKIFPQRYVGTYASTLNNLGAMYYYTNQYGKAIKVSSKSINLTRELAEINPAVYLPDLARRLNNMGCIYREKLNRKRALKYLEEALEIREKLVKEVSNVYLSEKAFTLINISVVFQKEPKNKTVSLEYLNKAIEILIRFRNIVSVKKYFENVNKILSAWDIDPNDYINNKWEANYKNGIQQKR